jgi:hypothetical protein
MMAPTAETLPPEVRRAFLDECQRRNLTPAEGLKFALSEWCGAEFTDRLHPNAPRRGRPRKIRIAPAIKEAA